jgi:mycothiol synthase
VHVAGPEELNRISELSGYSRATLEPTRVFVARRGETFAGYLIAQPDGAKSCVLLPPVAIDKPAEASLFAAWKVWFQTQGSTHALGFLHPEETNEAFALERHGFHKMTSIRDLERNLDLESEREESRVASDRSASLVWTRYANTDATFFGSILERTIVGSLDCPELNSLSKSGDLLTGYTRSAPDSKLWWLISHQSVPVGVVILLDRAETGTREIAYLGIVPEARQQGLGGRLLQEICTNSAQSAVTTLHVRVDERNLPALRLYHQKLFRLQRLCHVYLFQR